MQTQASSIVLFIIVTTCIILLLAVLIITLLYTYQSKQLDHQKKFNNLELTFEKTILKTQIEIQEETFQHISREIHDNISLNLTLAKLNLNTLNLSNSELLMNSIQSSVLLIGTAISDLSNLSKSMNPELISNMGLMKAIKIEVEKIQEMAHLFIDYTIKGEPIFMNSEKELIIFRIIQEAFNNIVKHSKATKVTLILDYTLEYLLILIVDNGIGFIKEEVFDNCDGSRAGLKNMQTRAKLFGGQFNVDSSHLDGTKIFVTVPYH